MQRSITELGRHCLQEDSIVYLNSQLRIQADENAARIEQLARKQESVEQWQATRAEAAETVEREEINRYQAQLDEMAEHVSKLELENSQHEQQKKQMRDLLLTQSLEAQMKRGEEMQKAQLQDVVPYCYARSGHC